MPTPTFVPLSTSTLASSGTTSYTISGISTAYKHLYVTVTRQANTNNQQVVFQINGVPNQYGYGNTRLVYRNGGSYVGGNGTQNQFNLSPASDSDFTQYTCGTTLLLNTNQTAVTRMAITRATQGNRAVGMMNQAYSYAPNGSTTSITFLVYSGTLEVGFTVSIYGIAG